MLDKANLVYGIDLGTTYSCIAQVANDNVPIVKRNKKGDSTTPSVVHIDGNNFIVGKVAKKMLTTKPEKTVAYIKREMSTKGNFDTTKFPEGKDPIFISGLILKQLVEEANAQFKNPEEYIKDVVITCPAYFGDEARKRTMQAGQAVGLNVLNIVDEPTAAAISYGMNIDENQVIMVYDLGGGTFDVSIIRVTDSAIEVIATGGDHKLGGKDWDELLAQEILDAYNNEHRQGQAPLTLDSDVKLKNKLLQEAEDVKMMLTDSSKATAELQHDGVNTSIEITRERFDFLTESKLKLTLDQIGETLNDAEKKGFKKSDIDKVLLVGGSSRMPQVKIAVDEFMDKESELSDDPDECIAKGAALYAVNKKYQDMIKRWEKDKKEGKAREDEKPEPPTIGGKYMVPIGNIANKTYGLGCWDKEKKENYVSNLIFKGMPLPAKVSNDTFRTIYDKQRSVAIKIYESIFTDPTEHTRIEVFEANKLGENIEHKILLTKDYPENTYINIEFDLNENGVLSVHANIKDNPLDKVDFKLTLEGEYTQEELAKSQVEMEMMVRG